jgi:hypothetical protein
MPNVIAPENHAAPPNGGAAAHQQQDHEMVVDHRQFGDLTVTSPMALPEATSHLSNLPDAVLSTTILQATDGDISDFSWDAFQSTFGPPNNKIRSLIRKAAMSLAKISSKRVNITNLINGRAKDLLNDIFPQHITVKTHGLSSKHQQALQPIQQDAKRSMLAVELKIDIANYTSKNEEFATIYPNLLNEIRIAHSTRLILPHQIDECFSFPEGVTDAVKETTARAFLSSHHHFHPVYVAFITEYNRVLSHFALRVAQQAEVARKKEEKKKVFEEARADKLKAATTALFNSAEADSL